MNEMFFFENRIIFISIRCELLFQSISQYFAIHLAGETILCAILFDVFPGLENFFSAESANAET